MANLDELRMMTADEMRAEFYKEVPMSRNHLEKAAFRQSKFFEKWYTLCEEFAADVRDWEDRLGRVKSRAEMRIRSMPAATLERKYGLYDLKEGAIKAMLELDKEVQRTKKKIRALKRIHMMLKGFVESGRQRKSMIRELEQLYAAKYWDKAD
ncbi:MAG: hypothetical protein ACYTBJ_00835 [Planctomycetota bacterium]|jgi:hypothetical protein